MESKALIGDRLLQYKKFEGKIASDKENKKLGQIIKLEEVREKSNQVPKLYAFILVKNLLRKDVVILIEYEKIIKNDAEYVWFDVLKKDFDQEVKETRLLMKMY